MKNTLLYNYGIEPDNLIKDNDNYCFYIDYEKYYFLVLTRPIEDVKKIVELTSNNSYFHALIPNRFSSLTTEYEDKQYVLLKVRGPENIEVDCLDLIKDIKFVDIKESPLKRNNWGDLWSEKVDYLEYQVSELGTNHEIVRKSFSYYIGLAENAIEYFNILDPKEERLVISRRRINYPLLQKDFHNPLEVVIDSVSRDFAGYFKAKFFEGSNPISEVKLLLDKKILTSLEYNLIFCRLLYPSYYFDKVHDIFERGCDDEVLLKYIEKVDEYELFLNEVFNLFKTESSMIKIDWLIKKS